MSTSKSNDSTIIDDEEEETLEYNEKGVFPAFFPPEVIQRQTTMLTSNSNDSAIIDEEEEETLESNEKGEFPAFFPPEVTGMPRVMHICVLESTASQVATRGEPSAARKSQESTPGIATMGGRTHHVHDDNGDDNKASLFAENNEMNGATQCTLPRLARQNHVERLPGAYAQGRLGAVVDDPMEVPPDSLEFAVDDPDIMDNNNGLAVAELVADEDPAELPQAKEAKMREEKAKEFETSIMFGVVVLVIILGIVIGVLVNHSKDNQVDDVLPPATMAPTSYAQAMQDSVLPLFPPETVDSMEDPDSPQSKALQWLLEDEDLPSMSDERIKQRFALVTFYFSTNGHEWKNNENWLSYSVHECGWYNSPEFAMKSVYSSALPGYLKEYPPPGPPPTTCHNDTGIYENFWLDNNNLVGSLPLEMYWLSSLQTLSLSINRFHGSISSHLGHLTKLQGLAISKKEILGEVETFGPIPSEIGLLTSMSILDLSGNRHEGSIPTEFWQLTNMSTMSITRSPILRGTILPTEIGNFQNLRYLFNSGCDFSGTIPTELGQVSTLEWILLNENRLTGTVPSEIGQLSNLILFSLSENQLEGTPPTELGLLTSSTQISLRDNRFWGSIPSELGQLNLAAKLKLRNNLLSGTIPTELGLFPRLVQLSLSGNQLTGDIPSEFGQLTMVGELSLANNSLSGTIPQELSVLQQALHSLFLEGNPMLSGIIPEALCTINGTCISTPLEACEAPFGLSFDCGRSLCGCGCSCGTD